MRFLRNRALPLLALLAVFVWTQLESGDPALYPPKPGAPVRSVWVVDHGWHAALILQTGDIGLLASDLETRDAAASARLITLARTMRASEWLEIGWGDEGFYRSDAASAFEVSPAVVLNALFRPTPTVMHVFPGLGPPRQAFPGSDVVELRVSEEGYRALLLAIGRSFAPSDGELRDLGAGLYGYARFYEADGAYSALHTCNSWASKMLRAAGVASSGVVSGLSVGLMTELRLANDGVY